jgi:hypothetical protein
MINQCLYTFADDTSILVAYTNVTYFNNNIHNVVEILNKCFKVNLLLLILIRPILHILWQWEIIDLNIGYKDKLIPSISITNFLGIILDSSLHSLGIIVLNCSQ